MLAIQSRIVVEMSIIIDQYIMTIAQSLLTGSNFLLFLKIFHYYTMLYSSVVQIIQMKNFSKFTLKIFNTTNGDLL